MLKMSSDKLNSKKYVCFQCYAVLDKYLNVSLISNIMVNGIAPQIPPELTTPSCHFVVPAWCRCGGGALRGELCVKLKCKCCDSDCSVTLWQEATTISGGLVYSSCLCFNVVKSRYMIYLLLSTSSPTNVRMFYMLVSM